MKFFQTSRMVNLLGSKPPTFLIEPLTIDCLMHTYPTTFLQIYLSTHYSFIHQPTHSTILPPIWLSVCPHAYPSTRISTHLLTHSLPIHPSFIILPPIYHISNHYSSIHSPTHPFIHQPDHPPRHTSIFFFYPPTCLHCLPVSTSQALSQLNVDQQ